MGYLVGERGQGIFKGLAYEVTDPSGLSTSFHSAEGLIAWGFTEFK